VQWILSPQGQDIVKQNGYVPLDRRVAVRRSIDKR
jgi:ABC-type phosphate transport system substrate-binding protein